MNERFFSPVKIRIERRGNTVVKQKSGKHNRTGSTCVVSSCHLPSAFSLLEGVAGNREGQFQSFHCFL